MMAHGYVRYTKGCRCEACRSAKREYMRAHRAAASRLVDDTTAAIGQPPKVVPPGIRHATRSAYEEHGCRCEACREVKRAAWRRESRHQRRSA